VCMDMSVAGGMPMGTPMLMIMGMMVRSRDAGMMVMSGQDRGSSRSISLRLARRENARKNKVLDVHTSHRQASNQHAVAMGINY
jgi:hypothetical protein